MSEATRVLIADDEASIRFVLRETLETEGCEVTEVEDGDSALEALLSGSFQIAFLDIRMPGHTGLEVLDRARTTGCDTAIVVITAQNTLENAVESTKRGAFDYLVKPFATAEIAALVARARRTRALEEEVRELRMEVGQLTSPGNRIVGKSPALLELFKTMGRVASRDVSVLVTGESGTGKELVARGLHAASGRAGGPFVAVNMAAIPRELIESELFGHERGAFTGAVGTRMGRFREASSGTLFLDEIGDLSIDLQAKLLRVLENAEVTPVGSQVAHAVDVRIVAATHRDLDEGVARGTFREDLLYRLRVVPLHIPPLRERTEDIPVLAQHFVARYAEELTGASRFLSEPALERLARHGWPGNVRELENAIKRALVLTSGDVLGTDDFAFLSDRRSTTKRSGDLSQQIANELEARLADPANEGAVYRGIIEQVERPLIEAALARTQGNQIRAAALLGINRNTLHKKIVELGIAIPERD